MQKDRLDPGTWKLLSDIVDNTASLVLQSPALPQIGIGRPHCNISWQHLPSAMAMLQSASLRARTSFTPSPVIAAVCFCAWRISPYLLATCGVAHYDTLYVAAASSISSSGGYGGSIYMPLCIFSPARFAMARASQDRHLITFRSTPLTFKICQRIGASARITSVRRRSPTGLKSFRDFQCLHLHSHCGQQAEHEVLLLQNCPQYSHQFRISSGKRETAQPPSDTFLHL